jgi:hypothetical protein
MNGAMSAETRQALADRRAKWYRVGVLQPLDTWYEVREYYGGEKLGEGQTIAHLTARSGLTYGQIRNLLAGNGNPWGEYNQGGVRVKIVRRDRQ